MNILILVFIINTLVIYKLDLPVRNWARSKLGQAMGMSMNVTGVLYLIWAFFGWLISFLSGLF
jgi:hypothetical protein